MSLVYGHVTNRGEDGGYFGYDEPLSPVPGWCIEAGAEDF